MSRPPPPWNIADVLDFEYLLAADADLATEQLVARDGAIFSKSIAPTLSPDSARDRRAVLHAWVAERRRDAGADLPGEHYTTGWQTLLTLAIVAGLLLGAALTIELLRYPEREPVNALVFLAATLGPQWILLAATLLLWIERRTTRLLTDWRPLRALLAGLLALFGAGMRRLSGESRTHLQATLARLSRKREIYGSLATWPMIVVTQVFAVSFNVAILATLLAQLPARELRFGWQTTFEVSSEDAARVVASLATPWQWAPNAHPGADEVIATRYAPGQRHDTLPGAAMRAWWPFLFYAVACYGLALRAAFLVFAGVKMRGALRRLTLDHADANKLWRRLHGPSVESQQGTAHFVPPALADEPAHTGAEGDCFALVADELTTDAAALGAELASRFRWRLAESAPVKIDNRRSCVEQLARLRESGPTLAGIVIVIPAARDPIVAIALFLREVIAAAGAKTEVLILLRADAASSGAAETRRKYWRDFLSIQHLHIGLELWCPQ